MTKYSESTLQYWSKHQKRDSIYLKIEMSMFSDNWFLLSMFVLREKASPIAGETFHTDKEGVEYVLHPYETLKGEELEFLDRPLELNLKSQERKRNRSVAAATDTTVLLIEEAWGRDRVIFGSETAELRYRHLLIQFRALEARAEHQAQWKLEGKKVEYRKGFIDHPDFPLADYQRLAVNLSINLPGYALFMDKGTGKTATTICRAMNESSKMSRTARILVVCPNQVRHNWKKEIQRFSTLKGRTTILRGGIRTRVKNMVMGIKKDLSNKWNIIIVGYDTARADVDLITRVPWDLVVLDESHYIRSTGRKRTQAAMAIRDISAQRLILTGSPICNSAVDLFNQLEFLGTGMSGFLNQKNFAKFFGDYETSENGIEKLVGVKNVPMLQERLSRISFQITKEEAGLNLPAKLYSTYEVEMSEEQEKVYKDLANKLRAEIEAERASSTMVRSLEVNHVLTKLLRLAQVTSGYMHLNAVVDLDTGETLAEEEFMHFVPNPKIEAVREILQETDKNCKTIIWTRFRQNIYDLEKLLTEMGVKFGSYYGSTSEVKRQEYVDSFNCDPEFTVLIAQISTAAEGLDLLGYDKENPEASKTYCGQEIFFSQGWSAVERSQAEDRAHRRGTRNSVSIIDLIVANTIDEEITNRVQGKLKMAAETLDIDEILRNVLG
jgi:SNF2 family DNA or RNA helicase